jgi:ketosteroid isomerase-like protein
VRELGCRGRVYMSDIRNAVKPLVARRLTNLVATDDTVVAEYTGRGTNTGTLQTPMGEIPATGRSVEIRFCDVVEFRGGEMAGGRSYYDLAGMMPSSGLAPEPAGTTA